MKVPATSPLPGRLPGTTVMMGVAGVVPLELESLSQLPLSAVIGWRPS